MRNIQLSIRRNLCTKQRNPPGHWNDIDKQRDFIKNLSEKLKIEKMEDWYRVSVQDFRNHNGSGLLLRYSGSPSKLIRAIFPEHDWNDNNRRRVTKGYWNDIQNQRKFMEQLFEKLGMKDDRWKSISFQTIKDNGGLHLLKPYRNKGMSYFLFKLFPDKIPSEEFHISYNRLESEIKKSPIRFFSNEENWKKLIEYLESQLEIRNPEDWYRISQRQIRKMIPFSSSRFDQLRSKLTSFYPIHEWQMEKFSEKIPKRANQAMMMRRVEELFPQSGEN